MNKLRFLSDTLNKSHVMGPNYTARTNFEMHGTFGDLISYSNNTVQRK
jgi:hypothetical protein